MTGAVNIKRTQRKERRMARLVVEITDDVIKKIRQAAKKAGMSIKDYVLKALRLN